MAPQGRGSPPTPTGMSRAEVMSLLEVVRNNVNDSATRAVHMNNNVMARIGELTKSLEFTQAQVDEYKTLIDTINSENNKIKSDNDKLTLQLNATNLENLDMKKQIDYLDDYSRRSNLRISGVPENPSETWQQCQKK